MRSTDLISDTPYYPLSVSKSMAPSDGSRRWYLSMVGLAGYTGLSGCLRMSESSAETTASTTARTSTSTETVDTTTSADSSATTQTDPAVYDVETFYLDNFERNGDRRESDGLLVRTESERVDIDGSWAGNDQLFSNQACARYSFDVLEGASVVASSEQRVLIFGYQYAIAQSAEAFFITHQPSVDPDWDRTLILSYPDGEHRVTPEVRPEEGVFRYDFSEGGVDPGRYSWTLEITPPDSFTIEIGTFTEELVDVDPESGSYPSTQDATKRAGDVANASATVVKPPEPVENTELEVDESGHSGGSGGDTTGQYLTRNAKVRCGSECQFGPGTDRRFRIRNHTDGTSLTFAPAESQ